MNLSEAPALYDQADQARVRAALQRADGENLKRGRDIALGSAFLKPGSVYNVTAHSGGGKASATPVAAQMTHVGTVAAAADSMLMFPALKDRVAFLRNSGAHALQLFGQGSDTINDVATATGISVANGTGIWLFCPVDGKWYSN